MIRNSIKPQSPLFFLYLVLIPLSLVILGADLLRDKLNRKPVFGLMTDFGLDFAVASMKGLLVTSLPDALITDIDHSLSKFSVLSGSFILGKIYRYFPMRYDFYLCR